MSQLIDFPGRRSPSDHSRNRCAAWRNACVGWRHGRTLLDRPATANVDGWFWSIA
jgi:hypothetical protein